MKPISTVRSGIAALAFVAGAIPAAGAFPERAITLIVPFAAGGPGDTVVRLVGAHMARTLGQPIVVENVTGAGGTSGITRGSQAKADGYTIMVGQYGNTWCCARAISQPEIRSGQGFCAHWTDGYHADRDHRQEGFSGQQSSEFVDYVKKNQDKVVEAHAGVGSVSHTTCTLLQSIMGTKTARVAYRGTGPSINDLVAGTRRLWL